MMDVRVANQSRSDLLNLPYQPYTQNAKRKGIRTVLKMNIPFKMINKLFGYMYLHYEFAHNLKILSYLIL